MLCKCLSLAVFKTAHNAASSALLLLACPSAYLILSFTSANIFMTAPAPPEGSPWLAPSKKAHGKFLSMTGAVRILFLFGAGLSLCS